MCCFPQLVAIDGNGFGLFSSLRRPMDLPVIAAGYNHGGSIKAPSSVARAGYATAAERALLRGQ
jgi:hypothetical protein